MTAVSAGPVRTLAARSIAGFTTMEDIVEERSPLRRHITADDVGSAAAYLLGEGVKGTSQLVVDQARRVVVGATFTGPGMAELLHSATIAIVGEVTLDRLWHAVPSFPTRSEIWLRLFEAYGL